MDRVKRLLEGRLAAAELELSYCGEHTNYLQYHGNDYHEIVRKNLIDEIKALECSLLILTNILTYASST